MTGLTTLPTWETTASTFGRYLRSSGKSQSTLRTYLSNLAVFWRWASLEGAHPYEADRQTVRLYISERLGTYSSARVHNDLAALRLFFDWLIELDYREDNPTTGIKVKRGKTVPTKPLTPPEVAALVQLVVRANATR